MGNDKSFLYYDSKIGEKKEIYMLKTHLDAIERRLIAQAGVQEATGHNIHKGTPRESFIREFLVNHLPENVSVGTGEIIDSSSKPGQKRNQYDIVIYNKNYPKLDFGGGISGFLIESIVATIEVKSKLSEPDLRQGIIAAKNCKSFNPSVIKSFQTGYIPPKPLNYLVAYNGPASMKTVYDWIPKILTDENIISIDLPTDQEKRTNTPSHSIDGIFVLGKGFLYYDNVLFGFFNDETRRKYSNIKWCYADTNDGNLLLFFLFLQIATQNLQAKWIDPLPYLSNFEVNDIKMGIA